MTSSPTSTLAPADASAIPGIRGLHSWGAVLVAVVFTAVGVVLNLNTDLAAGQATGWGLKILFVAGVVLAALAVRRGAIFTAMVQPPLVFAAGMIIGGLLHGSGLVNTGIDLVKAFPLMLVGTAAAIIIGLIRLVAQPLRGHSRSGRPQASAHA